MDEMDCIEVGLEVNLSPTTRLLLARITIVWLLTVVGTCIATGLPWGMHLLGVFNIDVQVCLTVGLWFALNGAAYVACACLFDKEDEYLKDRKYLEKRLERLENAELERRMEERRGIGA